VAITCFVVGALTAFVGCQEGTALPSFCQSFSMSV